MTVEQDQQRPEAEIRAIDQMGRDADEVLQNPAFVEAWRRLREEIVYAWSKADMRDTEGQKLILQQMKMLDRLQALLGEMVGAGEWAQHDLQKALARVAEEADEPDVVQRGMRQLRRLAGVR